MCGGEGHSAEICANVVNTIAWEDTKCCIHDSDAAMSDEEEEAFMCDTPGAYSDESNGGGVVVRLVGKWGISRLSAIVGHLATCVTSQVK